MAILSNQTNCDKIFYTSLFIVTGQAIEVQAATSGESNALSRAKAYLQIMPFSKKGLIKQLKFEGFTRFQYFLIPTLPGTLPG